MTSNPTTTADSLNAVLDWLKVNAPDIVNEYGEINSEGEFTEFLESGYVWGVYPEKKFMPGFKAIYNEGGGEGGGEHVEIVFSVNDNLFALYGSYYSYDGTNWDDVTAWTPVKPVQVKRYEAV